MRLLERLKAAFAPHSHSSTLSHYIPSLDYGDAPIENSVWRSDLERRYQDWKGDTGRVYNQQVLTNQGPLLFANKVVTTQGLGGTSIPYGQGVTVPVAGFAGRPPQLDATSIASEYVQVQQ